MTIRITDTQEYDEFIHELIILIAARNRLINRQHQQKDSFNELAAVTKSQRRIIPLAQALWKLLPGDAGPRVARKGKRLVVVGSDGDVWVNAHRVAGEVDHE